MLNEDLDFDLVGDNQIAGVEQLDLDTGVSARAVVLDAQDLLDFESAGGASFGGNPIALAVRGDEADSVSLDANGGSAWALQGTQVLGGAYGAGFFDIYSDGSTWVAIEQGIEVTV